MPDGNRATGPQKVDERWPSMCEKFELGLATLVSNRSFSFMRGLPATLAYAELASGCYKRPTTNAAKRRYFSQGLALDRGAAGVNSSMISLKKLHSQLLKSHYKRASLLE
jgi:hypothetical protein